ncbi:MAG: hypothetical protein GY708_07170 [Actinomycetia bacterium]|nr:hypothetical protein [Actinomycetes bacterium]
MSNWRIFPAIVVAGGVLGSSCDSGWSARKHWAAKADLQNIAIELQRYQALNDVYPAVDNIERLLPELNLVSGPILDPWGERYRYNRTGSGGNCYRLFSFGSDGDNEETSGGFPPHEEHHDLKLESGRWLSWPSVPRAADIAIDLRVVREGEGNYYLELRVENLGPDNSSGVAVELDMRASSCSIITLDGSAPLTEAFARVRLSEVRSRESTLVPAMVRCEVRSAPAGPFIAVAVEQGSQRIDLDLRNNVIAAPR